MTLRRLAQLLLAVMVVSVTAITPISAQAATTYSISGTVTLGPTAVRAGADEVLFNVSRVETPWLTATNGYPKTQADGSYVIPGLTPGTYRIFVAYLGTGNYSGIYWGNQIRGSMVTTVTIGSSNLTGRNITLPTKSVVSGVVSLGTSGAHPVPATVSWERQDGPYSTGSVSTDAEGRYSITLDPGVYYLRMAANGFQPGGLPSEFELRASTVTAPEVVLRPRGSISGQITLSPSGVPAGAGQVIITYSTCDGGCYEESTQYTTDAEGRYTIPNLMPGQYAVRARFVDSSYQPASYSPIYVTQGVLNPTANLVLRKSSSLQGEVRLGPGGRLAGAGEVRVSLSGGGSVLTDANGRYSIPSFAGGSYAIGTTYLGTDLYSGIWSGGTIFPWQATKTSFNSVDLEIDLELVPGGTLGGTVTTTTGTPASGVDVLLTYTTPAPVYPLGQRPLTFTTTTGADGSYTMRGLPPGGYVVSFYHSLSGLRQSYGVTATTDATVVPVTAGAATTGIDYRFVTLATITGAATCSVCGTPAMSGANQFYTLQVKMPDGSWIDEQVSGSYEYNENANYFFSPIYPGEYRVLGHFSTTTAWGIGTGEPFTVTAGANVPSTIALTVPPTTRITGADRFGTSAALANKWKGSDNLGTAPVVYVANGLNYPDALAAGPAAARDGAPLLLVTPSSIPATIRTQLAALSPERIVIVGGPPSVSLAVEQQLRSYATTVVRVTGNDRYGTSRALAEFSFLDPPSWAGPRPDASVAFIATGNNFPDAMAAGAAAAKMGGPIILVNGSASSADAATLDLLRRLDVDQIFVLGGPTTVSYGIEESLRNNLTPRLGVGRITGNNRFETSAYVNVQAFTTKGNPVILTSGLNYPDALSGGTFAARIGGAVFTVPGTCLPLETVRAIASLRPSEVYILGAPPLMARDIESLPICR